MPAPAHFTRTFGNEHSLLRREQKGGSPLLVAVAYSTVASITLSLLALPVFAPAVAIVLVLVVHHLRERRHWTTRARRRRRARSPSP